MAPTRRYREAKLPPVVERGPRDKREARSMEEFAHEALLRKSGAMRFRENALAELKEGRYGTASSAHQAVELRLKGALVERTGMRSYTRPLIELIDLLEAIGLKVTPEVEGCVEELEPRYLQARCTDARLGE